MYWHEISILASLWIEDFVGSRKACTFWQTDTAYKSTSSFFGFVSAASEVLSSDVGAAASDVGTAASEGGAAASDMGAVVSSDGAVSAGAKMTEWYIVCVSPATIHFAYSLSLSLSYSCLSYNPPVFTQISHPDSPQFLRSYPSWYFHSPAFLQSEENLKLVVFLQFGSLLGLFLRLLRP